MKKPEINTLMQDALKRAGIGTPKNAVDALIQEHLGPRAALLGKSARSPRISRKKAATPEEKREIDELNGRVRHHRSLSQIAEMLHCEGFNEFAAFGVLHYARTRLWGQGWGEAAEKRRATLAESMRPLSAEQRKAAGDFIHHQAAASFEGGLRIGLMASLWTLMLSAESDTPKTYTQAPSESEGTTQAPSIEPVDPALRKISTPWARMRKHYPRMVFDWHETEEAARQAILDSVSKDGLAKVQTVAYFPDEVPA